VAVLIAVSAARAVPLPQGLAASPSLVVRAADGSVLHAFLSEDEQWRIPVVLDEVDPDYLDALLRFEDKRFEAHLGADGIAVLRAAALNLSSGRVVSGGSTITMQLVRLMEPRPRTLRSKVVEAMRAVQLELRMSKQEILRAYLQRIPFGRNYEGIETGAQALFGHSAEALSDAEIATLLAIPQNPTARTPSTRNADRLLEARDRVAERLGLEVRDEPVPTVLRRMPREAPHAAWWLRARADPGAARIDTTIDRGVQRLVEEALEEARASLERRGIRHGTVVVIEHATMEVRGLAGNLRWDQEPGRQIAAFDVPRSPGSTLKPFVYAAAIDRGLALPSHLVRDVPIHYAGYSPKNYDGTFGGLVELEGALSRSLNVPFVELLGSIGVEPFLGKLRRMGVQSLRDEPGFYGLSVAVGGVELTPLEAAAMYATLARGGTTAPVTLIRSSDGPALAPNGGSRVFSQGASFLTRRALALRDRPDFPARRRLTGVPRAIHWKTGTSTGRRDAWAIGSGPTYTVAVWLGNLDGKGSSHLVGAPAAGPILFDVLEALHHSARATVPGPPGDLTDIEVCAYSGHIPSPACPTTRRTLALREHVPPERCPFHVTVDVDLDRGLAVRPGCRAGVRWEARTFLRWPSTVRHHLAARHRRLPEAPGLAPGCTPRGSDRPPAIVHPPAGHIALLLPGMDPESQQVPLQAEASGAEELAWFVDGALIGRVAADEQLWWTPAPGQHEIVVSDAKGRTARRMLEVRMRW
jgi:penicillin-binding protein 1C